jgi:hypothetical protein
MCGKAGKPQRFFSIVGDQYRNFLLYTLAHKGMVITGSNSLLSLYQKVLTQPRSQ